MIQANLGDQWTILFIAGIVTIWIPVTSRCFEDTLFGAIGTRPPIWVLDFWELGVTFAIAEGISHVPAILAHGLSPSAAGSNRPKAIIVACEERSMEGAQ